MQGQVFFVANAAFVRTKDNRLQCFYDTPDGGLCVRMHENGGWGRSVTVLRGAREGFVMNMADNGRLYIFAQDEAWNIHLCTNAPSGWSDQIVLRGRPGAAQNAFFHALIAETGLHLIYNVKTEGRQQALVSQRLGTDGQWGAAERLGGVSPIGGRLFQTQTVSREHMLLFYQACDPEQCLAYREIAPGRVGALHVLHTTGYQITDASFLTMPEALHALYIVKSPFSCQLLYRRQDAGGLCDPIVIWEAQRLDRCLLYMAEGVLTASCLSGGQVFACTANGAGAFSRPVRLRGAFCAEPIKAVYLSEPAMDAGVFFCRELYTDSVKPWEAQLLTIAPQVFYPLQIQIEVPPAPVEMPVREAAPVPEAVLRLQEQLERALRDGAEKDMQITQLSRQMRERAEETLTLEAQMQARINRAEREAAALREALRPARDVEEGRIAESANEDGSMPEGSGA